MKPNINFTPEEVEHGLDLLLNKRDEFIRWFQKHRAYIHIGARHDILDHLLQLSREAKGNTVLKARAEAHWRIVAGEDWTPEQSEKRILVKAAVILGLAAFFTIYGAASLTFDLLELFK